MFIAENLKAARKKKDMTQEEVAEILGVSPQSVSKWERGETYPDITLLPALAILYKTSVDALIGMDRINDVQAQREVFVAEQRHVYLGEYGAAADVLTQALKMYPNDEGMMSELAMVLALEGGEDNLRRAIALCERVLEGHRSEKVHHTTRAALSFIFLKAGDAERAAHVAKNLPHVRESREKILEEFARQPSIADIDTYLRFIALGESGEQDVITVDFGMGLVPAVLENRLVERVRELRGTQGYEKLPLVRIRDNPELAPNRMRVRRYADYLLDEVYGDGAAAADDALEALYKIVR